MIPTSNLEIVHIRLEDLKPYKFNPREHPPHQIDMLVKSITRFGFNNPVLITTDYEIIGGHGRAVAAVRCGLNSVPAIILPHLSKAERRAFRIADNKIALQSTWSMDLLRQEVGFLLEDDFAIDAEELGFETGEFDFLLANEDTKKPPAIGTD